MSRFEADGKHKFRNLKDVFNSKNADKMGKENKKDARFEGKTCRELIKKIRKNYKNRRENPMEKYRKSILKKLKPKKIQFSRSESIQSEMNSKKSLIAEKSDTADHSLSKAGKTLQPKQKQQFFDQKQDLWANMRTYKKPKNSGWSKKRKKLMRNGYLRTLKESAESVDEHEEKWIKKFANDKKQKKKPRKKASLKKIMVRKKYLEDEFGGGTDKTGENDELKEKKGNKKFRWKNPISSVRDISGNEERKLGIFGKVMECLCVYMPSKICPSKGE